MSPDEDSDVQSFVAFNERSWHFPLTSTIPRFFVEFNAQAVHQLVETAAAILKLFTIETPDRQSDKGYRVQ